MSFNQSSHPYRGGGGGISPQGTEARRRGVVRRTNDALGLVALLLTVLVAVQIVPSASAVTHQPIAFINAGGPAYRDSVGRTWEADSTNAYYGNASGSITSQSTADILGTSDDGLFQNSRSFMRARLLSPRGYEIPVPTIGNYTVTLYFAEIDPSRFTAGRRVFDIFVEGSLLYQNYDIAVAAGGGNKATTLTVTKTVNDGFLSVTFQAKRFNPTISAIAIVRVAPTWTTVNTTGLLDVRHEGCFVMVGNRAYLVGGRDVDPVNVYNPSNRTWTQEPGPGLKLHHMQCVVADSKIWIVSAWTGNCCREPNVASIYIYNTITKTWQTKPGLPEARRRGSGAAVLMGREIYLVAGNRGGHGTGVGVALPWFDKYNIDTNTWTTNLPNAPRARDHAGGGIVNGKLCVVTGRNSGAPDFSNATVHPTDCFNFASGAWEVHASVPQGRAGAAIATMCNGKLMVAGGEGYGRAWNRVDVFDGTTWTQAPSLQTARHGTGLAIHCGSTIDGGGTYYIASGSGAQGGRPELSTTEVLHF